MRLLILTHLYPPAISPRAHRWSALATHWASLGHEVHVIAGWAPGTSFDEVREGVRVVRTGGRLVEHVRHALRRGSLPFEATARVAAAQREGGPAPTLSGGARAAKTLHDLTWRQIYWPDYAVTYLMPAARTGRRLLGQHQFDGMFTVSPPFTCHVAGWLALQRPPLAWPRVPWVVDLGDPFSFLPGAPSNNTALYGRLNQATERTIFRAATNVAVTTDGTRDAYAAHFPELAEKIHVVPHLIDSTDQVGDLPYEEPYFPADRRLRLVFAGTLYQQIREPDGLLSLFRALLRTEIGPQLELHFVGHWSNCSAAFGPYGDLLGKRVFLHGVVPRSRALRAMREATVLVNIGNRSPYQLPSKVVEYAGLGRPILNVAPSPGDSSAAFLEACPGACSVVVPGGSPPEEATVRRAQQFLAEATSATSAPAAGNGDWLAPHRLQQVAQQYLDLLKWR